MMKTLSMLIVVLMTCLLIPAPAVAQASVSVGVGDATDITLTAPLLGDVSLLLTSTRETVTDDMDMGMGMGMMDTTVVSRLTGGVRYQRHVHDRLALHGDVGFGGWFGDGVINPREVWRNVEFKLGGKFYVTDSWGFGASSGYRSVGDDFEIGNLIRRPSETPWAVSLFGEF